MKFVWRCQASLSPDASGWLACLHVVIIVLVRWRVNVSMRLIKAPDQPAAHTGIKTKRLKRLKKGNILGCRPLPRPPRGLTAVHWVHGMDFIAEYPPSLLTLSGKRPPEKLTEGAASTCSILPACTHHWSRIQNGFSEGMESLSLLCFLSPHSLSLSLPLPVSLSLPSPCSLSLSSALALLLPLALSSSLSLSLSPHQ